MDDPAIVLAGHDVATSIADAIGSPAIPGLRNPESTSASLRACFAPGGPRPPVPHRPLNLHNASTFTSSISYFAGRMLQKVRSRNPGEPR
jgi:hypothetical protein